MSKRTLFNQEPGSLDCKCNVLLNALTIYLKSLHWLPFEVRRTYKIGCLCYHCHSSTAALYVPGGALVSALVS